MQVLLLTIDLDLVEELGLALRPRGIECSMAVEDPDAIVIDEALPDAAACVARLHADDLHRPILLLVSRDQLVAPPNGVRDVVPKPVDPRELAVRLTMAMRHRRATANPREALALTAVEAAGDIVEITSPDSRYEYVNPAYVKTTGFTYEEAVGRTPASVLRSDQHDASYFQAIAETLARGESWEGLLISKKKNGDLVYLESAISPAFDNAGKVTHHVAVKRDITTRLEAESELRRINAELEQARDAALEASRAKSQFLANMSHELRTPLNAIIGYSEMLSEDAQDRDDPEVVADLDKIRSAGKHLLALINDVLDLSKIEAGAMRLYLESFDLHTAIGGVLATINPLVLEHHNALVVDVPADIGVMRADLTKLRQALLNLLSNACKFTEHGTITVRARPVFEHGRPGYEIAVTDTGIGMSPDQVQRLFRPFVQADASTTRRYGGTGLGLAISQRFCELMGGHIEVTSTPAEGSTFRMVLPQMVVEAPRRRTSETMRAVDTVPENQPRVLVIDDDPVVQDVVHRTLSRQGFAVEAATDGKSGLRQASTNPPDAIVLDVMMPGLDGWGVLTALKGDPKTADIPVVMLTLIEQSDVGFALGAVDFLIKPVKTQRLASLLHRHCKRDVARVLVIDDDASGREVMRRTLEASGHRVREADNGRSGIEALAQQVPDLVLLDLMMPVMDGFAVLEHMRVHPPLAEVPVIVVTAKDLTGQDREMLRGARAILERGAYDRKDLIDMVTERVTELLQRRQEPVDSKRRSLRQPF